MIDLDDYSITKLKEYDFTKEADLYKGPIITQLAKFDDYIVYQLSRFDNKNVRDEKARENKLLSLTNPNKEIDLSDKTFEYMKKLGRYIVCHPKSNKDCQEPVEIYDEDFKLILKLKNNPIERLVDTALLNRDGKAYLLIKDSLATHYLIDLADNEENYQLNNISTVGRDLSSIDNKLVLNLSDATYIGYIDE